MNIFDLAYLFAMTAATTLIAFWPARLTPVRPTPRAPFSTRNNCIYNMNISTSRSLYYMPKNSTFKNKGQQQ